MTTKVIVSGCFDMLHTGHLGFLRMAAEYGRLTVCVASDATIVKLKGRPPEVPEDDRLRMVRELRCVDDAVLSPSSGILDFEPLMRERRPDVLVVNRDGDYCCKRSLCQELGIHYQVVDHKGGPHTAELRRVCRIPYRIDLAGGWLDQPHVSKLCPGPVIVVSLEPDQGFHGRSGMATSTRTVAQWLWGSRLPARDPVDLARILFACENPPGKTPISGSQDALGITLPGIHRLDYAGDYWPEKVTPLADPPVVSWLESVLWLAPTPPRPPELEVVAGAELTGERAVMLAKQANLAWEAVCCQDAALLGAAVSGTWEAQSALFPGMKPSVRAFDIYRDQALGIKMCGAGGGGYCLIVCERQLDGTLPVHIRTNED